MQSVEAEVQSLLREARLLLPPGSEVGLWEYRGITESSANDDEGRMFAHVVVQSSEGAARVIALRALIAALRVLQGDDH